VEHFRFRKIEGLGGRRRLTYLPFEIPVYLTNIMYENILIVKFSLVNCHTKILKWYQTQENANSNSVHK